VFEYVSHQYFIITMDDDPTVEREQPPTSTVECHFFIPQPTGSHPSTSSTFSTSSISDIFRAMSFPATFRAYEFAQYGDSLEVVKLNERVAQPPLKPTEVRLKVMSASLNPVDWKLAEAHLPSILPVQPAPEHPVRSGFDVAGVVVELGADVTDYKVGDEVYAMPAFSAIGSFAEFFNVDVSVIAKKPKNLTFDEAAGIPLAGQTSYQALIEHGKLQAGQTVLILGGSGGTGSLAVQIAKAVGAYVITTTSSRNAEWVKKDLGADRVIDYTKDHWSEVLEPHSVDLIFDTGVEMATWNTHAQRILKKKEGGAHFVSILPIPEPIESPIGAHHADFFTRMNSKDLSELTALAEAGKLKVVIDSVHPFENLKEATAVQKSGRAKGKIILHVADA
jgi:NADPH:quinone reductase-like Zn-dependent oxidoreductase